VTTRKIHPNLSDQLLAVGNDHAVQLCLCSALEAIADGLPDVNSALLQRTLDVLACGVLQDIRQRQQLLFDALGQTETANRALRLVGSRLTTELANDACAIIELNETLRLLARQGQASNPEVLGYLLRGLFEACRRHVAWQTEVLLPLAREHLCSNDRTSLSQRRSARVGDHRAVARA
jgi:hypothetical protein